MEKKSDVLVVEDDKAINDVVCRFIRSAGYSVRGALDGISALRAVEERLPGIILLDLMLPDIDGFHICQQLKSKTSTNAVPVVIVTAMSDDESRTRGLACGAVAYLTKPYDPDLLITLIERHTA
jgi:DNA-binding response OmpR family regulator